VKPLSSALTNAYRVVALLGIAALVAEAVFVLRHDVSPVVRLVGLVSVGGGSWVLYPYLLAQHVWLKDSSVLIGPERRVIPLREVARVDGTKWFQPRLAYFTTLSNSRKRVWFLPPVRMIHAWRVHPMVRLLRQRVEEAKAVGE